MEKKGIRARRRSRMSTAIEQEFTMTINQATFRMKNQAKRIEQLERALRFREARIDELVRMVHDLRTTVAKLQPGNPMASVAESPDYQPHIPKKRIPKAVIGRA